MLFQIDLLERREFLCNIFILPEKTCHEAAFHHPVEILLRISQQACSSSWLGPRDETGALITPTKRIEESDSNEVPRCLTSTLQDVLDDYAQPEDRRTHSNDSARMAQLSQDILVEGSKELLECYLHHRAL